MGANDATATMERSISPTNIANAIPIERRPTVVPWTSTLRKVSGLKRVGTKRPVAR